jgi:uncharacterized circularly permuted ATP-grasp superfamily protein
MATTDATNQPPTAAPYVPKEGCFDEALAADGSPRAHYAGVLGRITAGDLEDLRRRVGEAVSARNATFGPDEEFMVDPVPRILTATEWRELETGIAQRARALNRFIADAYGEQRIFDAGIVPHRLLESSPGYEPPLRGVLAPEVPAAGVAGLDLVRGPDGAFAVLEDNLRMPSGARYASVCREAVLDAVVPDTPPLPLDGYADELLAALRAAAPDGEGDPPVAVLSDGPENTAWFEQADLASIWGVPLVTPAQLFCERERLYGRVGNERVEIEVLYRRTDRERLTGADGGPTALGEVLLPPLRAGRLRCLNAFGTGIADDKLAHVHVEEMIRFYLGEEPVLSSVQAYDLAGEGGDEVRGRIEELVVKPRDGMGGKGVKILPDASERERRGAIDRVAGAPEGFVAQEMVRLSTHPTVSDGELAPRHVDLRPFVISAPGRTAVMTGGLTRFAAAPGEMIVNSSQGGGGKDTWVLPA